MEHKRTLKYENVHKLWFGYHFTIIKFHLFNRKLQSTSHSFFYMWKTTLQAPAETPITRLSKSYRLGLRPTWGPGWPASVKTNDPPVLPLILLWKMKRGANQQGCSENKIRTMGKFLVNWKCLHNQAIHIFFLIIESSYYLNINSKSKRPMEQSGNQGETFRTSTTLTIVAVYCFNILHLWWVYLLLYNLLFQAFKFFIT